MSEARVSLNTKKQQEDEFPYRLRQREDPKAKCRLQNDLNATTELLMDCTHPKNIGNEDIQVKMIQSSKA